MLVYSPMLRYNVRAMQEGDSQFTEIIAAAGPSIGELYARCKENAPNFSCSEEQFRGSIERSLLKFCRAADTPPTAEEVNAFIGQLQTDDLLMAIACSNGCERAWWEFDQQHRPYLERVARHLAKTEVDAQDVIDTVYVELYGTRVVDGERISKFATYSGRGSIRGWLRTVVWHSLVDLHRSSPDEVSLDEMTENVGEGAAHAAFLAGVDDGELEAVDQLAEKRYRKATIESLSAAFASLEPHERLLLLYYHVENLKLREIARLLENEDSPLRGWFQRKSQTRDSGGRTHESTVMRWLEKCYARVLDNFSNELSTTQGLSREESAICMELATRDLGSGDLFAKLSAT